MHCLRGREVDRKNVVLGAPFETRPAQEQAYYGGEMQETTLSQKPKPPTKGVRELESCILRQISRGRPNRICRRPRC